MNLKFKSQKHGVFVQMSSGLGLTGSPFLTVYAASKAY